MYAYEVTKYEAIARTVERIWAFFVGGTVLYFYKRLPLFIIMLLIGYIIRDSMRTVWGALDLSIELVFDLNRKYGFIF